MFMDVYKRVLFQSIHTMVHASLRCLLSQVAAPQGLSHPPLSPPPPRQTFELETLGPNVGSSAYQAGARQLLPQVRTLLDTELDPWSI